MHTACRRCGFSRNMLTCFPSFPDYPHICFLHHPVLLLSLLLLSRSAHGHAARLRIPHAVSRAEGAHSYTPTAGLQLLLCFPASVGISPSLCAATLLRSESSDDGVAQHLSMLHQRWVAIDPRRTPLAPRVRSWSPSQLAHGEQVPVPISWP